jgi:tetratricopeptide (TPR) repeat protein
MASPSAFERLAEDLSWFVTSPEIRVLHIAAGEDERPIALDQVRLTEAHACNRSPFFVLEDAYTRDEPGWLFRAFRVREIHELRRERMAEEGYALGELGNLATAPPDAPAALAQVLGQALVAQKTVPELEGLVLVLAPALLEKPKQFVSELQMLLDLAALRRVRAIVLECGDSAADALVAAFGPSAMSVRCVAGDGRGGPAKEGSTMQAQLAAAAAAPPGASPEMLAGFAGPKDVVAPTRHGQPPRDAPASLEVQELLARELGPEVALVGAAGRALQTRVFAAAAAMQRQRFADAIRLQTAARDQCLAMGMVRLGCILEITLGTYLLHAGDAPRARETLEASARRATEGRTPDVAAQAHLALAAVLALLREPRESAAHYRLAGDAAAPDAPLLAVEAYRLAGQMALRAGDEEMAVQCWQTALAAAGALPPPGAKASSAALTARSLARVLRDRGAAAGAASLLELADAYEQGATPQNPPERGPRPVATPRAETAGGALDVRE